MWTEIGQVMIWLPRLYHFADHWDGLSFFFFVVRKFVVLAVRFISMAVDFSSMAVVFTAVAVI